VSESHEKSCWRRFFCCLCFYTTTLFLFFTVKKSKFWVFSDRTLIRNWSSRRKAFGWRDERSQGKSTKWMRIFGMKIGSVLGSVLFAITDHLHITEGILWTIYLNDNFDTEKQYTLACAFTMLMMTFWMDQTFFVCVSAAKRNKKQLFWVVLFWPLSGREQDHRTDATKGNLTV